MRIAICVPDNHPSLLKPFVFSLMSVIASFQEWCTKKNEEHELVPLFNDNGRVDDMRCALANGAIKEKCDAILWLDSDMVFPPMTLIRMVSHFKRDPNLEAVSGLYTYKTPPYIPHIYPKITKEGKFRIASTFPVKEPFIIDGAGFGCLMMKTSVFKRVKKPYFTFVIKEGKIVKGEDLGFCLEAKMQMILDPEISCDHLRLAPFNIDSYAKFNDLEVKDGKLKLTKDKMHVIMELMPQLGSQTTDKI